MTFYVAALHKTDPNVIHWYTGKPAGEFISEDKSDAYPVPDEVRAVSVVKRLNAYTDLHGYTFCTVPRNCEQEHILGKLNAAMLRHEMGVEFIPYK